MKRFFFMSTRTSFTRRFLLLPLLGIIGACPNGHGAEQRFTDLVGNAPIGGVTQTSPLLVPFITWGGDTATFYANGGLTTQPGTIFQKQGLNLQLTPGDDFVQQVKDYRAGKTPFLRGTFHMIGQASEAIGSDPRTKGVVILQMTWSAGDHMIVRPHIKTVADLKGKTIALQQGGPHVGMLNDILKTAKLSWDDIRPVWAKDLTASDNSPPELFRRRNDIDACFGITPDMIGLCGGLQQTGTGAEGTVSGARVLVSTAELSRSIADVYVCRKDFYDANKPLINKFVAGYLKACEELVELKKLYETSGSPAFQTLLELTQSIYGTQTIPTLEDAYGLIADCTFVGYPGNVTFFTQSGNLHGFEAFQQSALDLAVTRGYASERMGLLPSGLDYQSPVFLDYLTKTKVERGERFRAEAVLSEIEALSSGGALDDRTILSFTINFEPNQESFSAVQYGGEFQRVVEVADKFGNAAIAIRGHADPTKTLLDLVRAGMKKGVLKRVGSQGDYAYSLNGRPVDLNSTGEITRLIESGAFDGVPDMNPRETMQAALNLSRLRAEAVRDSIVEYAQSKGLHFDKSQIQPVGVGIREPFVAKPRNLDEAKKNMRVEFRVVRVAAEATKASDFDF